MIIAYLRVSTGKQNPDNQKEEIRKFATEKGFLIDRWIVETVSGKIDKSHRKLGRALGKMKAGDTMIVTEVSRLSRSLTDIMTIMGMCLKKGINIYTTKERYAFDDTINSKVLCFAFGLAAEIERNLISMRTKEALAVRRAEGVVLGRRRGSCVKLRHLEANASIVHQMLASGCSISSICRKMKVSRYTFYRFMRQEGLAIGEDGSGDADISGDSGGSGDADISGDADC